MMKSDRFTVAGLSPTNIMAMTKTKKSRKSFFDLTDAEKDEAVKEFDKPIPSGRLRPLSRKQREQFERMQRDTPHVSFRVYDGHREVVLCFDEDLLNQTLAYARKNKMSLPKVIDRALRGLLAFDD
jgi:hypothetical protein